MIFFLLQEYINAETSDLHPSVMCTSKSKNEHPRFFRFYFVLNILYHAQQSEKRSEYATGKITRKDCC
jgi:hypothetical protein